MAFALPPASAPHHCYFHTETHPVGSLLVPGLTLWPSSGCCAPKQPAPPDLGSGNHKKGAIRSYHGDPGYVLGGTLSSAFISA